APNRASKANTTSALIPRRSRTSEVLAAGAGGTPPPDILMEPACDIRFQPCERKLLANSERLAAVRNGLQRFFNLVLNLGSKRRISQCCRVLLPVVRCPPNEIDEVLS